MGGLGSIFGDVFKFVGDNLPTIVDAATSKFSHLTTQNER